MLAEEFAQPAFGSAAMDSTADGVVGGDDTDAGLGSGAGFALFPEEHESPAVDAPALLADSLDVAGPAQVLLGAETHGSARGARDGARGDRRGAIRRR